MKIPILTLPPFWNVQYYCTKTSSQQWPRRVAGFKAYLHVTAFLSNQQGRPCGLRTRDSAKRMITTMNKMGGYFFNFASRLCPERSSYWPEHEIRQVL